VKLKLILPRAEAKTLSAFTHMLELLTPRTAGGRHNTMAFMPLSLPTLAALTPREVDVRIIDENIEDIDFDDPVDLVGITFVSFMAGRAYSIADAFRARGVFVVIGGVHATVATDEAAQHADAVIVGEAEAVWPQVLSDFRARKTRPLYRCETPPDLQSLVIPRWDLVSSKYYISPLVQTTRGCNFDCDFCTIRSLFGPPRHKPVEHVIREIQELNKHKYVPGPLKLMFADDNIIASVPYAKRLFRAMIPLKLGWNSQASINIAHDDELLDLARRSGCDALLIGFESVSQKSLDSVNKGRLNRVASFGSSIEKIHAKGINIYPFIVFGFDNDDSSVFQETVDFIQELGLDFPIFNLLTPIQGTRLHARMQAEGRLLPATWEQMDGYHVGMRPKLMSPEELRRGFLWSITTAYSHEAIFDRLNKSYLSGASRGATKDYIARVVVSVILGKRLLGSDLETRRFIARLLGEMWRRRDLKLQTSLMYLDRFLFARELPLLQGCEESQAQMRLEPVTDTH
jgi:radical SAM superfamily enzyme YgiQ (UPF0313 family)